MGGIPSPRPASKKGGIMIIILGGKLYIMTGKALRIIRQRAYDEGIQNCYKLCQEIYLRGLRKELNERDKGFIVAGISYDTGPEAFNPKLRKELDEILKDKAE